MLPHSRPPLAGTTCPRIIPPRRLVLSPAPSWRELLISLSWTTSPHPLLSPFLLESTERICGPCLWTVPSRGQRTGRTQPGSSVSTPVTEAVHHEVNPHAVGHEPATLHGAAQPQPVWMPQPFRAAQPRPTSSGGRPPPPTLPASPAGLALCQQHPQTRNLSPNTPGSWTPAPSAPFTKQRFTATR